MDISAILAGAGAIALLVGIFGGGIEAEKIKIPSLHAWVRLISALTGVILIAIAIGVSRPEWLSSLFPPPTPATTASVLTTTSPPSPETPTLPPTVAPSPTPPLIITTPTEIIAYVKMEEDRYVFQVFADRTLPTPQQLGGGGRIDFIWLIDADQRKDTGQSDRGNDYNIHLVIDETGWDAVVHPVSDVALSDEVNRRSSELSFTVEGRKAEVSFPTSILPNDTFRWWLEVTNINASPEWQVILKFPVTTPESDFTRMVPTPTDGEYKLDMGLESVNGCKAKVNGYVEHTQDGLLWEWGDSAVTKGLFPQEHTYSQTGTYTVKVTTSTGVSKTITVAVDCP